MSRVSRTVSKTVIHTFSRLLLPFDQRLLSHYWTAKEFVHEFYQRDGKWWHPPPHSLLILLDISLTSGVKHQWDVDKMNLLTPLLPAMAFTLFLSLSRFMPEARNYNWWWERDQKSMWDPWVSLIKNTQQRDEGMSIFCLLSTSFLLNHSIAQTLFFLIVWPNNEIKRTSGRRASDIFQTKGNNYSCYWSTSD